MASQQMINLMHRYSVTTRKQLLQAIADDYTMECCDACDEPFQPEDMEVTLDGMLEAEYQRIAGGAYDPLLQEQIDAEYMLTGWNDEMAEAERRAEERAFWSGM